MDAADSTPDQFAPDSVAADSEMMEEVADSMAADSEEIVPESEEMIVAPESQQFVAPESQQFVAPESQQFISPESEEIVSPESEEIVVPDSSPPGAFICGTCQVVHLNREAWDRVHTGRYPCSRCGLKHADYLFFAIVHGFDYFECEFFIPDVKNVVFGVGMEQIVLPADVLKKVEEEAKERRKRKLAAKKAMEDAKAAQR